MVRLINFFSFSCTSKSLLICSTPQSHCTPFGWRNFYGIWNFKKWLLPHQFGTAFWILSFDPSEYEGSFKNFFKQNKLRTSSHKVMHLAFDELLHLIHEELQQWPSSECSVSSIAPQNFLCRILDDYSFEWAYWVTIICEHI